MIFTRKCPKCGEEISYTTKRTKVSAEKRNTKCKSCATTGRIFSDERNKKVSKNHARYWLGKKRSKETRGKMRESKLGRNNPMYGKRAWNKGKTNVYSEEALKKMRLSRLKEIEENCGQVIPNSNPKATQIIRAKAKELGITDLRDAETPGGEFRVCGYFVDGFSKEKNIVIEYNEKAHKYQTERDERRKNKIISELGCKFIEIKE